MLAAETVDTTARAVAIYGAAVATAGAAWAVYSWKHTGAAVRVKRLTIEQDVLNPYNTRLLLIVVNNGRMPGRIEAVGISETDANNAYKRLELVARPTIEHGKDMRLEMPYDIAPGDRVIARAEMKDVMEKWHPEATLALVGWVQLATGRFRKSRMTRSVKTPPPFKPPEPAEATGSVGTARPDADTPSAASSTAELKRKINRIAKGLPPEDDLPPVD